MAPDLGVYPRATFLDRVAAFALDAILVGIAVNVLDLTRHDGWFPLLLVAYHIAFWAWRGTTLGGIVVARELDQLSLSAWLPAASSWDCECCVCRELSCGLPTPWCEDSAASFQLPRWGSGACGCFRIRRSKCGTTRLPAHWS